MDTQTLPLVPFGKYKGQPITTLMNDTKYLEWCKQQEWFQKYSIVYNICVNQTITTTNQNSKTPEHNKLQNLFLNEPIQLKLLDILLVKIGTQFKQNFELLILDEEFIKYFDSCTVTHDCGESNTSLTLNNGSGWFVPKFHRSLKDSKIIFEDKYNWDFILYYNDCQFINFNTKCDDDTKITTNLLYNIFKKYKFYKSCGEYLRPLTISINKKEKESNYGVWMNVDSINIRVCCELKPTLSDDYPCVLRKMKTQIELTENCKTFADLTKVYILLIGNFTSTQTSKEELIKIFKQSNIKVIFTDKIFDTSTSVTNKYVNTNTEQVLFENKMIEENKILKDNLLQTQQKLLQAEEKIKQLEEEIQLLKTQKQTKSIVDYFGKK